MRKLVAQFVTLFLGLATIVGAYLAAAAVQLEGLFWALLAFCILVILGRALFGWLADIAPKVRKYDSLISQLGEVTGQLQDAEAAAERWRLSIPAVWERGHREGVAAISGVIFAVKAGMPELKQVQVVDGRVLFLAHYPGTDPLTIVGARYSVVTPVTSELRGVLEVIKVDPDARQAVLQCVQPTDEEFWQVLAKQALIESTVPTGILLESYRVSADRAAPSLNTILGQETKEGLGSDG